MSIVTESPTYTMRSGAMPGKHGKGVLEDARVGLGDTDDVAVDDAQHGREGPDTDLADTAATELHLDLAGRVRHDAHRHAGSRQFGERCHRLGDRPPPQECVTSAAEHDRGVLAFVDPDTDRLDVGEVVLVPVGLAGDGTRLVRHREVVGAPVRLDRRITTERCQQRPEHGGIREDEHTARVEEDGVETTAACSLHPFVDQPPVFRSARSMSQVSNRSRNIDGSLAPLATTSSMSRFSTRQFA